VRTDSVDAVLAVLVSPGGGTPQVLCAATRGMRAPVRTGSVRAVLYWPPSGSRGGRVVRGRRVVGLVVVAVCVVALAVGWRARDDDKREVVVDGDAAVLRALTELPQGITELSDVPGDIYPNELFWMGREVALFGRARHSDAEGASYDPVTGTWRRWPELPSEKRHVPGAVLVWTGTVAVVLGVGCDEVPEEGDRDCDPGPLEAVTFDPVTLAWTSIQVPGGLPDPDVDEIGFGSCCDRLGWTGSEAVFEVRGEVRAYDVAAGAWREVPPPPLAIDGSHTTCDTGGGLLLAHGSGGPIARVDAVLLDGTSWRALPVLEVDVGSAYVGIHPICGPDGLFVASWVNPQAWYLRAGEGSWDELPHPDVPLDGGVESPIPTVNHVEMPPTVGPGQWTGQQFAFWDIDESIVTDSPIDPTQTSVEITWPGIGVIYDPATASWANVPPGPLWSSWNPYRPAVWRDGIGIGVVSTSDENVLTAYRPVAG
jgi:hypothetical protein